jgi:toxin ParE1/3/4
LSEVVWTETALAGLRQIRAYIGQFNPRAAIHVAESLRDEANSLAHFPHRGRPVGGTNMRELVASYPYIIRYRVVGADVVILRIRHAAQRPTNP